MAGQHFFLQRSFLERRSPLSPVQAGSDAVALLNWSSCAPRRLDDAGYVAYCALRSKSGQRGAAAAHSSQKKICLAGWVVSAIHLAADKLSGRAGLSLTKAAYGGPADQSWRL